MNYTGRMAVVRVTSTKAFEFACHSKACAPPPAGTGGSKSSGGGRSGGNARKAPIKGTFVDHDNATAGKAPRRSGVLDNERKIAPKAAAGGGTPKGKIQSVEESKKVTGSGGKAALVQTSKYKDGSTEIHVERTNSKYYGQSTTVTVKSKGKTIAKVFNDDDPPPSKAAVGRMLKHAKRYDDPNDLAGNLINEGGWRDYG